MTTALKVAASVLSPTFVSNAQRVGVEEAEQLAQDESGRLKANAGFPKYGDRNHHAIEKFNLSPLN